MSQTNPTFPEVYEYVSYSSIHQIKPEPLLVQRVKYEPDLTRDARDKEYVEKQLVFRTPCRFYHNTPVTPLGVVMIFFRESEFNLFEI